MTGLGQWLRALDEALTSPAATDASDLDLLIEQGATMLADAMSRPLATPVDAEQLARVQGHLRRAADQLAVEVESVRRERRDLASAGRAHAGYHAASVSG